MRNLIIVLLLVGCLGAAGYWYKVHNASAVVSYHTTPILRGELLATIGATGTLEPEEVVDVGAQVQGRIIKFGPDPRISQKTIDFNTEVEKDSVLAVIDDVLYAADVDTAEAQVKSAQANVKKAQADVNQFNAKLVQAKKDWDRAQKSLDSKVMSQADVDSFEAAYQSGLANVEAAKASVELAQAGVRSADASLKRARQNLSYCTITSPVKGVIIDRRVNIGQTVVSSLSAPSLFLIAKDLTKMQIWASVNEADIGHIKVDQAVTFTVDTHPGNAFKGVVGKIRMNAQTTQNVVTYTVEINYDNTDRALKPYQTTNVAFEVDRHEGVLMVPNAALRWAPAAASRTGGKGPPAQSAEPTTKRTEGAAKKHGTIYVADGSNPPKAIKVKVVSSDGTSTEISSPDIKEGMEVILSEVRPDEMTGDAKNPFMPQFGRGRGGR